MLSDNEVSQSDSDKQPKVSALPLELVCSYGISVTPMFKGPREGEVCTQGQEVKVQVCTCHY